MSGRRSCVIFTICDLERASNGERTLCNPERDQRNCAGKRYWMLLHCSLHRRWQRGCQALSNLLHAQQMKRTAATTSVQAGGEIASAVKSSHLAGWSQLCHGTSCPLWPCHNAAETIKSQLRLMQKLLPRWSSSQTSTQSSAETAQAFPWEQSTDATSIQYERNEEDEVSRFDSTRSASSKTLPNPRGSDARRVSHAQLPAPARGRASAPAHVGGLCPPHSHADFISFGAYLRWLCAQIAQPHQR